MAVGTAHSQTHLNVWTRFSLANPTEHVVRSLGAQLAESQLQLFLQFWEIADLTRDKLADFFSVATFSGTKASIHVLRNLRMASATSTPSGLSTLWLILWR